MSPRRARCHRIRRTFDHLAQGRFIFGVNPGALASDAEALGILNEDRNKLFAEAIDVILAIWERDFHPLSANFLLPHWLPGHWANYSEGRRRAGKTADPADWRIARTIFVADDEKVAERYGKRDSNSPYRFCWRQLRVKLTISRRQIVFKTHEAQDDAELTDDYVVDRLVICGTVNRVVDEILKFREQVGDFGELVYAGMDWVDPKLAKRSTELMATEVMPRVDKAIGGSTQPQRAAARGMRDEG